MIDINTATDCPDEIISKLIAEIERQRTLVDEAEKNGMTKAVNIIQQHCLYLEKHTDPIGMACRSAIESALEAVLEERGSMDEKQ